MKQIFAFILLVLITINKISGQSNANGLSDLLKTDSHSDSVRKQIYAIISDEIVKALDVNISGDKNLEFLFTIKFRIDRLDSITYYASTLDGRKRNDDLFAALNIGLKQIVKDKLDYKVYEDEDIVVPIGISYKPTKDTTSKPISILSLSRLIQCESFIFSKVSKRYKPNQAIQKCYLWPMIYFVKPYSKPQDFM